MITGDADAEPIEAIAVETGRPNPLLSVLAWLAVGAVIVFVGWWVWTRWIDPPAGGVIARYVDNGGVKFESPADQFVATFPTRWTRSTSQNDVGTAVTVRSRVGDYEFSVTKTPQPEAALNDYTTALNVTVGKFATDFDAGIVDQKPTVLLVDVVVKSAVLRQGDTYWRIELLLLRDRLYTIIAKTPNADPAPYNRLLRSFLILGPR